MKRKVVKPRSEQGEVLFLGGCSLVSYRILEDEKWCCERCTVRTWILYFEISLLDALLDIVIVKALRSNVLLGPFKSCCCYCWWEWRYFKALSAREEGSAKIKGMVHHITTSSAIFFFSFFQKKGKKNRSFWLHHINQEKNLHRWINDLWPVNLRHGMGLTQ